jgi:hypothetical protein
MLFFRNLFIDGQDSDIGRIIFNYFSARWLGLLEDIEGLLKKQVLRKNDIMH